MVTIPTLRQGVRFDSVPEGQRALQDRLRVAVQTLTSLLPQHLLPQALNEPVGAVRVTKRGVDWKGKGNIKGPFIRSLLGSLMRTSSEVEVPLLQRPVNDDGSGSTDSDDDGSVEVPKGFARFDYHSNFIADEANTGVLPAVHAVLLVEHSLVEDFVHLSKFKLGSKILDAELPQVPGLTGLLAHIGFLA